VLRNPALRITSTVGGKEPGYDMYMVPPAIWGESQARKEEVMNELAEKGIKSLSIEYAE